MSITKNQYKATFILDVRGYQEPLETLFNKLETAVGAAHGKVNRVVDLGQRDFARVPNRKFPAGHYVQIEFAAPPSAPQALQEKLRLDRTVSRIFIETAA